MEDLIKRFTGSLIYVVHLLFGLYSRQHMWLFVCAFLLIVAIYEWERLSTHAHHPKKTILTSAIVLFIFLQFGLFFSKFAYGPTWNNISILSGIIYYLFCALVFRGSLFDKKYVPGAFIYILLPFIFLYLLEIVRAHV